MQRVTERARIDSDLPSYWRKPQGIIIEELGSVKLMARTLRLQVSRS